jgi:hypothetical protein
MPITVILVLPVTGKARTLVAGVVVSVKVSPPPNFRRKENVNSLYVLLLASITTSPAGE